ncbi:MAG: hypothetical protein K0U37_09510 [Gammaproteobacteria bacterium]|nr:hypothetical protein [Gammaproteobacteria bacterium]
MLCLKGKTKEEQVKEVKRLVRKGEIYHVWQAIDYLRSKGLSEPEIIQEVTLDDIEEARERSAGMAWTASMYNDSRLGMTHSEHMRNLGSLERFVQFSCIHSPQFADAKSNQDNLKIQMIAMLNIKESSIEKIRIIDGKFTIYFKELADFFDDGLKELKRKKGIDKSITFSLSKVQEYFKNSDESSSSMRCG